MLTEKIKYTLFKNKINNSSIKKKLKIILNEDNEVLKSLGKNYQSSFKKSLLSKYYKFNNFRIIGMGGSSLGSQAIYDFLKSKTKKKFNFVNNLQAQNKPDKKKTFVNLIISKSGNTIETISNANILINKKDKNIFITEKKKSNLYFLAKKLKSDIIHHNNYIGGRYSVLSEVGMVPAELMGLSPNNFRRFNSLIKNKNFINNLISNVASLLYLSKKKKFNSIIINYDERSDSIFKWYQQLVAESLGKKKKGFLPIVSTMPKDNHSVMQLYLDGFKNNFFTIFNCKEQNSDKLDNHEFLETNKYLRNQSVNSIILKQKIATEKVFIKKKLPFRSFQIDLRDEKTIGELFCFFILETILLGQALKVNPFDQPSVELIKDETKRQFSQ